MFIFPDWEGSGGLYGFPKILPTAKKRNSKIIIIKSLSGLYTELYGHMSSFHKLNEYLILFSLRHLFYMRLDSTAMYSSFDTLFFMPLIIPCPSPTRSLTRSSTDHNEPNKKHYCDISLCLQGLAWLWHAAIVKLEGCWRNTVKKNTNLV